jgi:hypothetical protein
MLTSLWRKLIQGVRKGSARTAGRAGRGNRARLNVEGLEARWMPSRTRVLTPPEPLPTDRHAAAGLGGYVMYDHPIGPVQAPAESQAGATPAFQGSSLTINGQQMVETAANYQTYIKYLVVAPQNQHGNIFWHGTMAQIKAAGLEDPLRRQIFDAMSNNQTYTFQFLTLAGAQENFALRVEAVAFMKKISSGTAGFKFYDQTNLPSAGPDWHQVYDGTTKASKYWTAFSTNQGVTASTGIEEVVNHGFRGDCLGAVEMTIFEAVEKTIQASRFDAEHPEGLRGVGKNGGDSTMSIWKNINAHFSGIRAQDVVPGDWAYMQNDPSYGQKLKPGIIGYWFGENTICVGKDAAGNPLFCGMGIKLPQTEAQLRAKLAKGFTTDTGQQPNTSLIRWTLLAQPITGG